MGAEKYPNWDDYESQELYEIQLALEREKPTAWSPAMRKLYFVLFFAFWGSAMNGYDGSLMGAIYGFDQFLSFWKIDREGAIMSTMIVTYQVGCFVAAFFAGPASDTWGRKAGMGIGSIIICVGTVLMGSARADMLPLYLVGRFLSGFGVVITTTAAPAYVIELSHPVYRGTIGGFYNTLWFVGNLISQWVAFATHKIESELSWKIPIWTQLIPCFIMLVGLPFMPESPRWLIAAGKTERAHEVLVKYHANGNHHSQVVALEFTEMVENIQTNGSDKRFWDYSEIFNTRGARYRFLMVFFISFFGQQSGNNIFSYFNYTALGAAGIEDVNLILLINGVLSVINFCVALVGARSTDKFGRRSLIIAGTVALSLCLIIITVGTAVANPSGAEAAQITDRVPVYVAIAGIYLFQIIYAICWTPMQALYPVECLATTSRAKGIGMSQMVVYVSGAISTYAIPLGIKAIGWKFYIIYVIWDLIEAALLHFFMVETKGLTLEELDEVFESPNPVKTSMRLRVELAAELRG